MKKILYIILGILFFVNLAYAQPPWLKFSYFQNWGGLNDNLSDTEIEDNEASDIQNVIFDTGGALRKRYGYDAVPDNPVQAVATGSISCINGLAQYQKDNGNRFVVAICNNDNKATAMKKDYDVGGGLEAGAWENIDYAGLPSNFTNNDLADFAIAEDNLIITLPGTTKSYPFQWTGTGAVSNLTSDADCPQASIVEYHKNHLFVNDVNNTSRINFSALDDITDWTANDFIDCQTQDGYKVRGMISAFGNLYIFKDNSIFRLSGYDRDSWILDKVVEEVGSLSQQSICIINNLIYFTTSQGDKAVYDGGYNVVFISQKIRNTIGSLNFNRAQYSLGIGFSTYKYKDFDYYNSVSLAGSAQNNLILLFDTQFKAWTKFNNFEVNAWCVGKDDAGKDLLIFGDYDGYVHSYPTQNYRDIDVATSQISGFYEVTQPINAFYETKWFKYSDVSLGEKYWRLLKTYALSETTENTYLYAECRSDYESSGKINNIYLSESGAKWDVAVWDVDTWGGQGLKIGRGEIDKGTNIFQIRYYNDVLDEGFKIFGYEIFIEPTNRI